MCLRLAVSVQIETKLLENNSLLREEKRWIVFPSFPFYKQKRKRDYGFGIERLLLLVHREEEGGDEGEKSEQRGRES